MKPLIRHTSEPIKDKPVKGHKIGVKLVGRTGLHTWKPSKHAKRKRTK